MTKKMVFDRFFGLEMEGYINRHPEHVGLPHGAEWHTDGSLRNANWRGRTYPGGEYGVEVACAKTKEISDVLNVFETLRGAEWHIDSRAGTHVHISAEDFTNADKARLRMFCHDIQNVMFLFVGDDRYSNNYCKKLREEWGEIFTHRVIDMNDLQQSRLSFPDWFRQNIWHNESVDYPYYEMFQMEKYDWINVCTRYPTVEFRLFTPITSESQIIDYVNLAQGIVQLVKHSTVAQLKFIANEIMICNNPIEMANKFLDAIGIDSEIPIIGGNQNIMLTDFIENRRKAFARLAAKQKQTMTNNERRQRARLQMLSRASNMRNFVRQAQPNRQEAHYTQYATINHF